MCLRGSLSVFALFVAVLLGAQPRSVQAAYCVVSGQTLEAAVVAYARACSAPREDCDKLPDGQWACASFDNPDLADLGLAPVQEPVAESAPAEDDVDAKPSPVEEPVSTVHLDEDVAMDETRCMAAGESLSKAVRKYAQACSLPRRDCDPTGLRGQYVCASFNNPTLADLDAMQRETETSAEVIAVIEEARPQPEPTEQPEEVSQVETPAQVSGQNDDPAAPEAVTEDNTAAGADPECTAIGSNLRLAIDNYARQCNQPRVDCDPYPGGYICGSYRNPELIDEATTSDLVASAPQQDEGASVSDEAPHTPVSWDEASNSDASPTNLPDSRRALPAGSLYEPGDFIALHYDNAPDPDDAHATVAGLMVISHFGLRDVTGVVSGAYGAPVKHVYRPASEAVFQAAWGEEGSAQTWFNAHQHRELSLQRSADIWERTLRNGGRVMVAEGGQSDYTADVIRELARRDSALVLSDIWVFQHSYGPKSFNESQATQADLQYVKRHATYVKVPNGNKTNDSANLNQKNPAVANRFLASELYGEAWAAAFTYLNPYTRKFDGSDTVELLYILGLDSRTIADWADFADYFLPAD